jgi:hypothetical protein
VYTVLPERPSAFYREELRGLLESCTAWREKFINTIFNHLHTIISEMKVMHTETQNTQLTSVQRTQHLKECKRFYAITYDLLRVLEALTGVYINVFIMKDSIFMGRLTDFIMSFLRQVVDGQISNIIQQLSQNESKFQNTFPMFEFL